MIRLKVPARRVAGVLLVVVASVSVLQSCRSTADHQRYVECQARINDALIARTRNLIEVAENERAAQRARDDALDATFLDPSLLKPVEQRTAADRARVGELYRTYRRAAETLRVERVAADQARAANPVPAPPSEACE